MAALKAVHAVIDLLFISAEDFMDRTPAVPTTSEPIPLAHPASHLATPFDLAPPPGSTAGPAEPTKMELTASSNKVNLLQYLAQAPECYTLHRAVRNPHTPQRYCETCGHMCRREMTPARSAAEPHGCA